MYVKNSKSGWIWNNKYLNSHYSRSGTIIATDFDGVITNPHELKATELHTFGFSFPHEETSRQYCIKIKKVPEKIYESVTFKVNISNLLSVPLEKNVKEVMDKILDADNMIFIVTSRYNHEMPSLFQYLDKNDLRCNGIINTCRNNKLGTLINLRPDIYIDDAPEKLYELFVNSDGAKVHPMLIGCKLILYRNISNRYVKNLRAPIIEVKRGWEEIEEIITTLKTRKKSYSFVCVEKEVWQ